MQFPVIHIVKRLGRVGGMESYVWYLVHGLAEEGIQVAVVCEQVCEFPDNRIQIVKVEVSPERPRWRSMLKFRLSVDQKIREVFSGQFVLVHSHERSLCHQVTTFHGPPIEQPKVLGWFSRFNKRFCSWRQMERDELLGRSVQMVLPVSSKVRDELLCRYPEVNGRRIDLAYPGVQYPKTVARGSQQFCLEDLKFVFVGKEWKRKGLDIAVRIVEEFRRSHGNATLTVFGCERRELPRSLRTLRWMIVRGWSKDVPWTDFDMLLHPARKEPFGMVVAEARAHGLPVLMSSNVGAADLRFSNIWINDLDAPVTDWVEAVESLALAVDTTPEIKWAWVDLVAKHTQFIYPQLEAIKL